MASTTPERSSNEQEPLLGHPGDASQAKGAGLQYNLILGTAVLAQAGTWILAAVIWASVFTHTVSFFSPHPLLQSAAVVLFVQGILVLQPTHTKQQKIYGTYVHSAFNALGVACLIAGWIIIEMNKASHPENRFKSPHAIIGLVTYILFFIQAIVGVVQFYLPKLLGGEQNAKKLYKYHRISGYLIVVVSLVAIGATPYTSFNKSVLHIQTWSLVVPSLLLLAGLFARIKKQKLGF